MSDSLSTWLALREGADRAARSPALTRDVVDRLARVSPVRVLDLGAGTGANLRYLTPLLGARQRWLLVDQDVRLLDEAKARASTSGTEVGCEVDTRAMDLVSLDRLEMFGGCDLVTASALLDLVSEQWLGVLAARCREMKATALFALNYNGRSRCTPVEAEDEEIRELMNRHQRSDKGLGGVAAGPGAVDASERCFTAAGYVVRREASDWNLPPELRELQRQLILGWAQAAVEIAPDTRPRIEDWLARRLAHVAAGRSHIVVGHDDVAAWLP